MAAQVLTKGEVRRALQDARHEGEAVPVACEQCGATVYVTRSEAAGVAFVFCSARCEDRHDLN